MSWHPEDHYPANPDARPPDEDLAGWSRFYALEWVDASGRRTTWGVGQCQYGGGCLDCHLVEIADRLDALYGALEEIEATEPVIGGDNLRFRTSAALKKWRSISEMGGCDVIAEGQSVNIFKDEADVVVGVLEELLRVAP